MNYWTKKFKQLNDKYWDGKLSTVKVIVRDLSMFRISRAKRRLGGRRCGLTITSVPGANIIRPSSIRRVNSRRY